MNRHPRRLEYVKGHRISQYGRLWYKEVYVDAKLYDGSFKAAVEWCKQRPYRR